MDQNPTVESSEKNVHFAGKYFEEIEEISESDNYFVPVLKELAQIVDLKQAKVLDVGCGTGLFMKQILNEGCTQCYGVDGHTDFAELAIKRGYREVKQINDLNVDTLPFEENTFDVVVCKDVFEHLLNPTHTLTEIRRVLKPGGIFLLHVPNHFPVSARFKFLFSNDIDTFSFFKDESRWTFPHIRFYEFNDSLKVLNSFNFTLVKDLSYHFGSIPFFSRFGFLKGLVKKLTIQYPNQFAEGFTLLVRKGNV